MRATPNTPQTRQEAPTSDPSPLPMLRRTAPASRPSGRCAVGLRPSLDPDAFLGVPGTYGERPKKDQQHPLTGPVPSGMTCAFASGVTQLRWDGTQAAVYLNHSIESPTYLNHAGPSI